MPDAIAVTAQNDPADKSVAVTHPVFTTDALFGELKEIVIHHQGDDYRLRITRNNKLILTK
jgi:hemin uptake protein HemP